MTVLSVLLSTFIAAQPAPAPAGKAPTGAKPPPGKAVPAAAVPDAGVAEAPPPPPPPAAAPEDPKAKIRQALTGTFTYSGDDKEKKAREEAIAKSTEGVFFMVRGIVGSRVNDKTRIPSGVSFAFNEGKVTTTFIPPEGAPRPYTTAEDGKPVTLKVDTEDMDVAHIIRGDALIQTFKAVDGKSQYEWVLEPDGKTLHQHVTIKSERLPKVLAYSLTYTKKS